MFRTELVLPSGSFEITHGNKLLTIGSCFSQVIGERLYHNKFDVLVNPFGTIFNPVSICRLLEMALSKTLPEDAFVERQGVWFNHYFHSEFCGNTETELKKLIEQKIQQVHSHLAQKDTLIVTLGTAFVYRVKSSNEIVANCHKVPSGNFTKELLSSKDITSSFQMLFSKLKVLNSKLKVILTVSPVRHTKDTLALNSVSKAILRTACHELCEALPEVVYFPSFELMMDDLRDYRFYKADMIHPSEVAEDYIWNKFSDCYFNPETKNSIKEWAVVAKAIQHKPFREDSESYRLFLKATLEKVELLHQRINLQNERNVLLGMIAASTNVKQ